MYSSDLIQNICYGVNDKKIDIPKIKSIIQSLNLESLVINSELLNFETRNIDMDSTNISGGEKQRIAIARALYADSRLIVLDEPSSALDKYSQENLIRAILRIKENRTIIIITHSDRLIEACDTTVELENGKITNIYSR
jgi:HlyD family secretion protein